LDSYLPGLMGGLTGPDAELREIQDKVLDIMGHLGTAHEHLLDKLDPPSSTVQFSREEGTGLMEVIHQFSWLVMLQPQSHKNVEWQS